MTVWLLPVALVPWLLLAGGAALGVSALSVKFRDLRDLVGHLLNLLFFSSPIIYSLDGLDLPPWLERILRLNPLASLVEVYRDVVFTGAIPGIRLWLLALAVGLAGWILGAFIFVRFRRALGDLPADSRLPRPLPHGRSQSTDATVGDHRRDLALVA